MSDTNTTPTELPAQTMHKAVAAFITSLVVILGVLGVKTGWATPDMIELAASVVGALITGFITWKIPNKAKA